MSATSAQQVGADADAAAEARALGNGLYRAGNLTQAEEAYKKAALLAPQDASPISNLSAVKYEMGDYRAAITYIQKATSLAFSGTDTDDAKKDKLYSRMAKCYLHLLDVHSAEEAISAIGDGHVRAELQESAESIKALSGESPDEALLRGHVLDRLPRYKPCLTSILEYFCVGHDRMDLLKEQFGTKGAGSPDISFLFAGSGDGRNVFSAIMGMMLREEATEGPCFGKLHFTLVDLKPAALARVLIFLYMMIRGETEVVQGDPRGDDCFLDMAYLFSCQIIPPWVEARLQTSISELIKRLEGEGDDVLEFVFVAENDRKPLARVLRQWQHPWPGLSNAREVRKFVKPRQRSDRLRAEALFGGKRDGSNKSEKADFENLTVVLPPAAVAERRETSLVKPLADYRSTGDIKGLRQHIRSNWRVNNTLIDYDFADAVRQQGETGFGAIEFDPLEVTESMGAPPPRGEGDSSSIEKLAMVFRGFSTSTFGFSIEGRLVVELIVGEAADVMERIRYKTLPHRLSPPRGDPRGSSMLDPALFPRTFDYVHMSNIPDYIGGHLTSFLAGRPLLKEDQPSSLRFVNLLNPPEFPDHETFQSEYLLMYKMQHIRRHFLVTRRPGELTRADLPQAFKTSLTPFPLMPFAFEGYMIWDRMPSSTMSHEQLLPKPAFEKWIYAHLLKICLPYPRPVFSGQPVYAPLNLTALIRLAVAMFEVGYPAHWLLRILSCICTGVITTRARPPTKRVSDPSDVDANPPARQMTVQPWVPEFTTLLSIWRRLLPFGTDSLGGALVPLASIAKYTIAFPTPVRAENNRLPHFMLLFWNTKVGCCSAKPPHNIYHLLVNNSDGGDNSTSARDIRTRAVVCVTTFHYMPASRTAEFWMRADKMEDIMSGTWNAFIWRTDTWEAVTCGVDVSTGIVRREKWTMVS